jgi:hypothetical protein
VIVSTIVDVSKIVDVSSTVDVSKTVDVNVFVGTLWRSLVEISVELTVGLLG